MRTILYSQFLILNSTLCKDASISFMVNAICHEMIHYYDTWFGDVLVSLLNAHKNRELFNEHLTRVFESKSQEANSMSLTVFPDANGISIDKLNSLSAVRLSRKKLLNEIESLKDLEDKITGSDRLNYFNPHAVVTDLEDGRFAVSF